ncbi:MAG: helix-turn-helix transcriptional regulator [Clostridia bacterium]|nr:helix-turn-helix transcriptional regulator [Clostridia bacterium]
MSQYENHHLEDAPLPFIFKSRSERPTNHRFGSSNWHENIEIIHITEGNGSISVNGHVLSVCAGDIVMINSNHLHALAGGENRMFHRYLIVDRSFCLANGFDSNKITYQLKIEDERVRELMNELNSAYESPEEAPYKTLTIRSLVLQLLVLLSTHHSRPSEQNDRHDRGAAYTKQAIDYIRAAYDRDFSLEEVAAFVGISKYYLSREFHRYTGYPFVAYVNRTRCKKAQQMLADERLEIQEIGKRCGFESASYFARAFRRHIGMSPAEYRSTILKIRDAGQKEEEK